MKIGDKKCFIYVPSLGFVEAGKTREETLKNINQAEVDLEIENKKIRRLLQQEFPNCEIIQGINWSLGIAKE
ncbi:hypothetical protein [Peribacillus alkalitolerans]|uniref:hypothetical protein n=1 Tax=Peribacillus alkalitolerans TaxID=1550385 RepID=UPI0013D80BBE|nr:hypothetical protein [Peribacillus alkalitolerans]